MSADLPVPKGRRRPRSRRGIRTARGASLLEIVLATVIVSLVTLGVVEFFAKGRVWFDQEEHKREATLLAQDALERTISRSYATIVNWAETRIVDRTSYGIAVSVLTDNPEPGMKTVRSKVTWRARPSTAQRSVTLATMVRQP